MDVDVVLRYIQEDSSSSDLYRIAYALKSLSFECLLKRLPDDVLLHVCSFLRPTDRLGFARAFQGCTNALNAILLEETAVESLRKTLQRLGDHDLYALPSCLQMKTFFVCNWTAFSPSCPSYVGRTFWASRPPHARVDCRAYAIKRIVREVLKRGCAVVRVSSFLEAHHTSLSTTKVRLNGRVSHILKDPIQTQEIELLPPRLVLMLQREHTALQ